jgi:hypothetical protein
VKVGKNSSTTLGSPSVECITPAAARTLLESNTHNRNVRLNRVAQLADAMERGEWELNGETIKVAVDGTLLDGQHRLQAIVDSGVTIHSLVLRDLSHAAQDTVDTGRRRRLADVLAIEGYPDSHALAAAVSHLYRFLAGQRIDAHGEAPSTREALELLRERPQLSESVRVARRVVKRVGGPTAVFSALHCVFAEIDPLPTEEFFARLADGANLSVGDPVLHLRNQLTRPQQDRNFKQSPSTVAALTIKAFNLRRAGRQIDALTFRANERFPKITPPVTG